MLLLLFSVSLYLPHLLYRATVEDERGSGVDDIVSELEIDGDEVDGKEDVLRSVKVDEGLNARASEVELQVGRDEITETHGAKAAVDDGDIEG